MTAKRYSRYELHQGLREIWQSVHDLSPPSQAEEATWSEDQLPHIQALIEKKWGFHVSLAILAQYTTIEILADYLHQAPNAHQLSATCHQRAYAQQQARERHHE